MSLTQPQLPVLGEHTASWRAVVRAEGVAAEDEPMAKRLQSQARGA